MTDWQVITGDCLEVMRGMDANSVDSIITDPPYGLSFMGKDWDHGIPGVPFWEAALHVAKPGAMLLAFGGTRTFHRLAVAIEDAGWEIRDTVMWVYGSGFPKSHDISKAIDKAAGQVGTYGDYKTPDHAIKRKPGNERMHEGYQRPWRDDPAIEDRNAREYAPATDAARQWDGWGTSLKPAWEPIIVAMKPLDGTFAANALEWGVAGLWIDGGRVPANGDDYGRSAANSNGTVNKGDFFSGLKSGDGLNGYASPSGRWPANVIHDGSDEVLAGFPQSEGMKKGVLRRGVTTGASIGGNGRYGTAAPQTVETGYSDTGSAARFFYCAKSSRAERNAGLEGMPEYPPEFKGPQDGREFIAPDGTRHSRGYSHVPRANHHPTVKPIALMRYLARLTKTPTGGVVLDPFAGSGSTGCAAVMEGRRFIGIELSDEYADIARKRIAHAAEQARQLELL